MAAPFNVHFDEARVSQMRALLTISPLPKEPVDALDDDSINLGIKLDWLKAAKDEFVNFDIGALEDRINEFQHFITPIEDVKLHFIHQRSPRPDAIALILLHGWPGLFFDFHKIIAPLTNPPDSSSPAFHVVVPSLPGYAWSILPRKHAFSIVDIARVFNTLMVDVLGYKSYAAQAGDWGSFALRYMGVNHAEHLKLAHFNMFPCPPVDSLPDSERSEIEKRTLERESQFFSEGFGYHKLQATRPATIGYAIASSPIALLAYVGEKMLAWSDPTSLSVSAILDTVAIYYLTESFQTSVMIYQQSTEAWSDILGKETWRRLKIRCPVGYSLFPYEIAPAPKTWIEKCAPLVEYYEHERGGHFPALDAPEDLIRDVRALVKGHWKG